MKNNLKILCITALVTLSPVFLFAQTAEELEAVMNTAVVSCAQAARFVIGSCGDNPGITADNAFRFAKDQGWLSQKTAPDDPIKIGALSFLMMKAFDIKGGLLYIIFPGPRYAFRSMVSLNIIQGTADPSMTISGERFLLILGNVLKIAGGE